MLQNIMKRYKSLSLFSIVLMGHLLVGLTGVLHAFEPNAGAPMAGMPEFNEQELEQMQQQVMDEIGQLPQEEQDKIFEEAARIAEKMESAIAEIGEDAFNQMGEEELMQFFDTLFTEEEKTEEPTEEVQEKPQEQKEVQKITSEQEKLLETIRTIINRIESFLVKASSIPELPEKTKKWIKNGKITEWPKDAAFDSVKDKIEELNQKLYKLLDTDPKTKEYRYIQELSKDEALRNNLTNLQATLVQHEPQVEVSTFGLKKMGRTAKQATQKVLNTLGEAVTKLTVIESFATIFATYEPEAKKIKEAEEAAIKKAEEEAKKPQAPGRAVTGGQPEAAGSDYYGGQTPDYGYGYGAPSGYGDHGAPSYGQPSTQPARPETKTPTKGKSGAGTKTAAGDIENKDGKKDDATYAPRQEDPTITQKLHDISTNVEKAAEAIKESEALRTIKTHITDDKPVEDTALKNLPLATRSFKKATSEIKSLQRKIQSYSKERKEHYKKEVETQVNEHIDSIKTVFDQIDSIKKERDKLNVSDEKKQAYLGEEKQVPAGTEQPAKLTSIFDLKEAYKELQDAINDLTGEAEKKENGLPQAGMSISHR